MKRASYKEAIQWIAYNDDTSFAREDDPVISVTGALVADLFDVSQEKVIGDIRVILDRMNIE